MIIFVFMDEFVKIEKSQNEFYFSCYDKFTQRELYEKYYKILKIISGTANLSNNKTNITVRTGDFVFVNQGGFSRIRMYPEKRRPFKLLCLNFTDNFLRKCLKDQTHLLGIKSRVGAFETIESNIMLEALFSSLNVYATNNSPMDMVTVDLKLRECIHILSQNNPQLLNEMLCLQIGKRVELEEFMNSNYMYNAPLVRFAELSGRSLSSFRREFVQLYGTTPNRWLIKKRLDVAYQKLTEVGCKVSDIYLELGFETLSHFSRKFKEQYGISQSKLLGHNDQTEYRMSLK